MADNKLRRKKTGHLGAAGEALAAQYLEKKGYKIIERNVHFRASEIDLIAQIGRVLVFVEVKARLGLALPAEAVTQAKLKKLHLALRQYLLYHPAKEYRLDVVAINFLAQGETKIEHYENVSLD